MSKKYMIYAKYSASGVSGILKLGGTARQAAVEKMLSEIGGKVESFYYTLNADIAYVICELPDDITAAAVSMHVDATGMVDVNVISLLTPSEIDEASKKSVHYTAPGS
ncbi:MAG: GYD domain-containing protein [Saprospiraceae bacterium]|nr:GYD domain-containing protein [Saprospiraceae bacterium]